MNGRDSSIGIWITERKALGPAMGIDYQGWYFLEVPRVSLLLRKISTNLFISKAYNKDHRTPLDSFYKLRNHTSSPTPNPQLPPRQSRKASSAPKPEPVPPPSPPNTRSIPPPPETHLPLPLVHRILDIIQPRLQPNPPRILDPHTIRLELDPPHAPERLLPNPHAPHLLAPLKAQLHLALHLPPRIIPAEHDVLLYRKLRIPAGDGRAGRVAQAQQVEGLVGRLRRDDARAARVVEGVAPQDGLARGGPQGGYVQACRVGVLAGDVAVLVEEVFGGDAGRGDGE